MVVAPSGGRNWNISRAPRAAASRYHSGMNRLLRNLLLLVGYSVAFHLAYQAASLFWHPPAGLRFATFLLVPPVMWLPLMLAIELFGWLLDPQGWSQDFRGWAWFLFFFAGAASGPSLLRARGFLRIDGPASMGWLLGAMLLSALGESLANFSWPFKDAAGMAEAAEIAQGHLFVQLVLGDYIGMLILVPLALMCVRQRPQAAYWPGLRVDLPFVLLPSMLVAAVVFSGAVDYRTYFFATALCLVPATYMAFRSGWRGAAVALTAISMLVAASGWFNAQTQATVESQVFIAVAGGAVLILGAAIDALRDKQDELQRQNRVLESANIRLDQVSEQLRETARRNMTMSEDLRRWITSELHDELGQNLTALQVRIKLAEGNPARPEAFAPVHDIVSAMRRSVSGLLAELRPSVLDEFGLLRSLAEGPVAHLVQSAGLRYRMRFDGDPQLIDRLDDDVKTALYRIVQEAATNTLRHADAGWFGIRLRVREARTGIHVVLVCADDGVGMPASRRPGAIGLRGISDRVLSFGGRLRIRSHGMGVALLVAIDLPHGGGGT